MTTATAAPQPQLMDLAAQYGNINGPQYGPQYAAFSDVGNPKGLPSFNPTEPAYVFWMAGPLAILDLFTGPGLKRAVFNAAQYVLEHGPVVLPAMQPVTEPVIAAVAAYVAANPALVPGGTVVPIYTPPVVTPAAPPVPFADAVSPIPGMSMTDLLYVDKMVQTNSRAGGLWELVVPAGTTLAQIHSGSTLIGNAYADLLASYDTATYNGPFKAAVAAALASLQKPAAPAAPAATAATAAPATRAQEAAGGHPVKTFVRTTSSQQGVPGFGGKRG